MIGDPSFSIVIPTFQRREIVLDAIEALSKTVYSGAIEAIVVVDGSTDGTAAALAATRLAFPLRVVEQPNRGAASARNVGASHATGDVILFLDDDMMSEPDLVEQHARMYREAADAVVGHIPVDPGSPPGFLTSSVTKWIDESRVGPKLTPFDIFTGQLSVRRAVFETLGGFTEEYTSGSSFAHEDTEFGVRLLARWDVRYNPHALSRQRYVVRPREIMRRASQAAVTDLRFVSEHPALSPRLFQERRASAKRAKYLYRPLSWVPLLPKITAELAIVTAEIALKTRFRSNAAVRKFFGFAQGLSYWSAIRANGGMPDSEKLLVLCYHAIEDQSGDPVLAPYGVPPELFQRQLQWLRRRRSNFISPAALASFLEDGSALPRRSVLLTFDDCYAELLNLAKDVLKPSGIAGVAFAVTGMDSDSNEWDQQQGSNRLELLGSEGLRDLNWLGFEIGSHSRTHREMPLLSDQELEAETSGSAEDLVLKDLPRPRFFAYPYGSRNAATIEAVRAAGYLAAFGCRSSYLKRDSDRYDLPRVSIYAYDEGWRFRMKVRAPRLVARLEQLRDGMNRKFRGRGRRQNGSE